MAISMQFVERVTLARYIRSFITNRTLNRSIARPEFHSEESSIYMSPRSGRSANLDREKKDVAPVFRTYVEMTIANSFRTNLKELLNCLFQIIRIMGKFAL